MRNKSDGSISSLLIDNQSITSAKQSSDHFNKFFTSKSKKNSSFISWPWKQKHTFSFYNSTWGCRRDIRFSENKQSKWSKYYTNQYLETIQERIFKTFKWYDKYVFQSRCISKYTQNSKCYPYPQKRWQARL